MTSIGARHAPPKASAMLEALRGLGYSTAAALADLIDNSIAAGADEVDALFDWKGPSSTIRVIDNGMGMDTRELEAAMRLGEINPLLTRNPTDLGRFGLGLKTASFSQCRRLTVATSANGATSCLRWDLDFLASAEDDGWYLLEGPAKGSEKLTEPVSHVNHGTLVLWEGLDRIVTEGFAQQDFLDLMDRVEAHLSMVFQRFIDKPGAKLRLKINGRPVKPLDPFLLHHPATWSSPVVTLRTGISNVQVQCHVLPHKDRLSDGEQQDGAGPHGWTAQQGFYVYRNRRLLVAGSWLGLGRGRWWTKEEAHRLARIRIDIPNTADADWNIDVRKSSARPPVQIREQLTQLAEDTRARARKVFAHRGIPIPSATLGPVMQAWRSEHFSGGMRYKIDTQHPVIRSLLEDAGEMSERIHAALRVIEETVPIQRIWLDTAELRETPRTGFTGAADSDVQSVLSVVYRNLVLRKGVPSAEARQTLLQTEPFNNYPHLVASLPNLDADHSNGGH